LQVLKLAEKLGWRSWAMSRSTARRSTNVSKHKEMSYERMKTHRVLPAEE
jgi:hypothetical protein